MPSVMNKTPRGTIQASRHAMGVVVGLYGKEAPISMEYNPETDQIEILVRDELLKKQGLVVKHVDQNWR